MLTVIMVVLAVMLLVKIYDALVGEGPAQQDAKLLAQTVNGMLQDKRPYIQTAMLLRVGPDNRIVGFDSHNTGTGGARIVTVPKNGCTSATRIGNDTSFSLSTTACTAGACICDSSGGTVGTCYPLSAGKGVDIWLAGNYQDYDTCLPAKAVTPLTQYLGTTITDPSIAGSYTQFVIDKNAVAYWAAANREAPPGTNGGQTGQQGAIIPVIIEKVTTGTDQVFITIAPDSNRIRGRSFYLYQCPANSVTGCDNETGASSLQKQGGAQYCTPRLADGLCTLQPIAQCGAFCGLVQSPCLCDGAPAGLGGYHVATHDYCSRVTDHIVPVNCDAVKPSDCASYCTMDGTDSDNCSEDELIACDFDACGKAPPGQACASAVKTGLLGGATTVCAPVSDTASIAKARAACS